MSHDFIKSRKNKMHTILPIFTLFLFNPFTLTQGYGEVYFGSIPESLDITNNNELDGTILKDMLYVSSGYSVEIVKEYHGLKIKNPFDLPKVIAITVDGIDKMKLNDKLKCHELSGNYPPKSYRFQNSDLNNMVINLNQVDESFETYTGLNRKELDEIPIEEPTKYLKPELHSEDKQFLREIGWMKLLESIYASGKNQPDILEIRLSLVPIAKTHGENSDAVIEASTKILERFKAIQEVATQSSDTKPLVVLIVNKAELLREKRQAEPAEKDNDNSLNLADYYDEDYPVVFNIILWFMVVFAFVLLAICYAIGSMDPGRDSIIYRMTSTRMKKDN